MGTKLQIETTQKKEERKREENEVAAFGCGKYRLSGVPVEREEYERWLNQIMSQIVLECMDDARQCLLIIIYFVRFWKLFSDVLTSLFWDIIKYLSFSIVLLLFWGPIGLIFTTVLFCSPLLLLPSGSSFMRYLIKSFKISEWASSRVLFFFFFFE